LSSNSSDTLLLIATTTMLTTITIPTNTNNHPMSVCDIRLLRKLLWSGSVCARTVTNDISFSSPDKVVNYSISAQCEAVVIHVRGVMVRAYLVSQRVLRYTSVVAPADR